MTKLEAVNLILRKAGLGYVGSLGVTSEAKLAEEVLKTCLFEVQARPWNFNTRIGAKLSPSLFSAVTAAWTASNKRLTASVAGSFVDSAIGQTVETSLGGKAKVTARSDDWIELDTSISATDVGSLTVTAKDGQVKLEDGIYIFCESAKQDSYRAITVRGRVLFDIDNNTEIFANPIYVNYKVAYDIGCLQEHIAQYVAAYAAVEFFSQSMNADRSRYQPAQQAREQAARVAKSIDSMQSKADTFRDRGQFGGRLRDPSVGKIRNV